jgi:hypothetical protein
LCVRRNRTRQSSEARPRNPSPAVVAVSLRHVRLLVQMFGVHRPAYEGVLQERPCWTVQVLSGTAPLRTLEGEMSDYPPRVDVSAHNCRVGHRWGEEENDNGDRYCVDCGAMMRPHGRLVLYWRGGAEGDVVGGPSRPCPATVRAQRERT